MRGVTLALVLALGGCAAVPTGTDVRSDAAGVVLDSQGLRPADSALRIDFGRAKAGVVPAVTRLVGSPPETDGVNAECGAGPVNTVSWDGLDLNFQDGALLGWVVSSDAYPVAGGLRVGQTRAALDAVAVGFYEETSLGTEFEAGGVFGLLEDDRIALLWSGVTCFFR